MDAPPPTPGSPRLELPRAPSPTEARPLRRIPVPEEFVPLGKREWDPNRKYWAAAGTCHMILYFQDPVLERYGQGVEQSLGPIGRYFSYPLDDPKQSNQRNQILQPFYSMGKFCFQVGTLPYKLVVDPPWEAEYDLGYYRPGRPHPARHHHDHPHRRRPAPQGLASTEPAGPGTTRTVPATLESPQGPRIPTPGAFGRRRIMKIIQISKKSIISANLLLCRRDSPVLRWIGSEITARAGGKPRTNASHKSG